MALQEQCRNLTLELFPKRTRLDGRHRDVDSRNHINNIAVAELFSEARARFIIDLFGDAPRGQRQFFVVGQQAVFYAGEAKFPGRIEIGSGLFTIGRSTLRFGQSFFNDGRCTAIAEAALVFSSGGSSAPLPPFLRERAQKYLFETDRAPPRQLIAEEKVPPSDGPTAG